MPLLSIPGELEKVFSEWLYPYRYVLIPLALAVASGLSVAAVRLGYVTTVMTQLRKHPRMSVAVAAPVLIFSLVAGNYLLSPLWERNELIEASPLDGNSVNSGFEMGVEVGPRTVLKGMFKGADDFHFGSGDALVIQSKPDEYVLRLENFSVRNGPDLYVYLSRDVRGDKVEEMLNIGRLKATDGAFNYEIPPEIDLRQVKSVVVWCKQFSVKFASAPLEPTG